MAVLTIRNLPNEVRDRLRLRAARSGCSMEAEVRHILTLASLEPRDKIDANELQDWVGHLYAGRKPGHVVADLIQDRRREAAKAQRSRS